MKTLTITPSMYDTRLKLSGLSMKAMGSDGHDLLRDEFGYYLSNDFNLNGRTAKIRSSYLIHFIRLIHEHIPFDKIKLDGHYELTEEQLMAEVLKY